MNDIKQLIIDALESKKANDITVIDIDEYTTIADFMVVADADNINQLDAMSDALTDALAKEKIFPKTTEGKKTSGWILLDYQDFIVHLFSHEMRQFYDIERLWKAIPEAE